MAEGRREELLDEFSNCGLFFRHELMGAEQCFDDVRDHYPECLGHIERQALEYPIKCYLVGAVGCLTDSELKALYDLAADMPATLKRTTSRA